jgi:cysteine desulfurase/selenocysteine lyase
MIDKVTFAKTTYQEPPIRFEAGTPIIAEVIALQEALQYIDRIGRLNIEKWEKELLLYATKRLEEIPNLRIIGRAKEKGGIISFVMKGIHSLDLGTFLDCKGIAVRTGHHCAQPTMDRFGVEATTRVSFGIYNTFDEIDYFMASLREVIKKLA